MLQICQDRVLAQIHSQNLILLLLGCMLQICQDNFLQKNPLIAGMYVAYMSGSCSGTDTFPKFNPLIAGMYVAYMSGSFSTK